MTVNTVLKELKDSVIRGDSPLSVIDSIGSLIDKRISALKNFIESKSRQLNQYMLLWEYQDKGSSRYLYFAEGESCEDCNLLSGKVFSIADAEIGVNLPPIHPNCDCLITVLDADGNAVAVLKNEKADETSDTKIPDYVHRELIKARVPDKSSAVRLLSSDAVIGSSAKTAFQLVEWTDNSVRKEDQINNGLTPEQKTAIHNSSYEEYSILFIYINATDFISYHLSKDKGYGEYGWFPLREVLSALSGRSKDEVVAYDDFTKDIVFYINNHDKCINMVVRANITQLDNAKNNEMSFNVYNAENESEIIGQLKLKFKNDWRNDTTYVSIWDIANLVSGKTYSFDNNGTDSFTFELNESSEDKGRGNSEVYAKVSTDNNRLSPEEQVANAEYIYDYLSKKGWTKEAICGLLGNIEYESHFNPGAWEVGVKNPGYGLV
ncbi:MAG: Phage Mu protein F like protein [Firmicutes bacterium ADurb.Bin193]|nr:MAG: Phage Mu protein F like protein [Firmicutes bacterium ADurb.Bin193]